MTQTQIRNVLSVPVIAVDGPRVKVEITDRVYNLDDDDPDSPIAELAAAGYSARWLDDYEPQPSGRTKVTIFISPR